MLSISVQATPVCAFRKFLAQMPVRLTEVANAMSQHDEQFDRAVDNLGRRRTVHLGDSSIQIACLVRTADWRPLSAPWWRGKEVCVVGADIDGNFFLRHCDGSIRHWDHRLQKEQIVAKSVREFAALITNEQR